MKMYGITTLTSEGFFHDIYEIIHDPQTPDIAPWMTGEVGAQSLDRYYYFVHSGDKFASRMIESQYDEETGISAENRLLIAKMFLDVHGVMLNRQWANYVKQYDPLQPYDVTEETDYTHGNISTVEDDGTVTTERKGKEESLVASRSDTDSVYGFNSGTTPVPSEKTDFGQVTNTTTYGGDGTESQKREDVRTLDTVKTSRDNSTDDLTTHKYGTLGTTSMAEIMSSEIKTWMWNFYLKCLFPAVDSMLTIPIY